MTKSPRESSKPLVLYRNVHTLGLKTWSYRFCSEQCYYGVSYVGKIKKQSMDPAKDAKMGCSK